MKLADQTSNRTLVTSSNTVDLGDNNTAHCTRSIHLRRGVPKKIRRYSGAHKIRLVRRRAEFFRRQRRDTLPAEGSTIGESNRIFPESASSTDCYHVYKIFGGGRRVLLQVPRVFVNGKCIGGGSETQRLLETGELINLVRHCMPDAGYCECGKSKF